MLEHRVGAVPVRECSCPQPPFIDCKKPPFMAKRWTIPDPVPPPLQSQHGYVLTCVRLPLAQPAIPAEP